MLDVFRWMEPTPDYKSPYTSCNETECSEMYYYNGTIKDKNCLITNSSLLIEAVSCDEKYNAICAYQSLPDREKSFCSQSLNTNACVQSNYSSHSKCFCQGSMMEHSQKPRAEFQKPYQNLLYSSLNDTCHIGLHKINGSYFWINSNSTITYSYWAENAIFDDQYSYGAMTADGWIMTDSQEDSHCVLYEAEAVVSKGEIILDYSNEWLRFVVNITSPKSWLFEENGSFPMVFCFTDATKDALVSKIHVNLLEMSEHQASFHFNESKDGPGTYWCEAFSYPEVLAKSSNRYLLMHNAEETEEYAVIVKKTYAKDEDPLSENSIKKYQQLFTEQVQSFSDISHYFVRIYQIVDIDEVNLEITINFHLLNPNPNKSLVDYIKIHDHLKDDLTAFTNVDMFSVDTCVGFQTQANPITWPSALIGESVNPKEGYCVAEDGRIIVKVCSGNYIIGARWSDDSESCTIQSINATINLTNILLHKNPQQFLDQIVEISMCTLGVYDIELIAKFLEKVSHTSKVDTNAIALLINHLMRVSPEVLKESQQVYNATEKILLHLRDILNRSNFFAKLRTENLFVLSYDQSSSIPKAIVITENDGNYGYYEIFDDTNLDSMLKMDYFKAALLLNEAISSVLEETSTNSKVVVTIYTNSNLFNEMVEESKETDIVIGLTLPYMPNNTSEIVTAYKTSDSRDFICSFWEYDPNQNTSYWAEGMKITLNESIVTCRYNQPKQFTLVRDEKENITKQLEEILDAEVCLSDKLKDASVLLSNHNANVKPIDLKLVSDLLEQAADNPEDDNLELVTDIVNLIIDVPTEVLYTSQIAHNATGRILMFFEQILQNCTSTQVIEKSNIYALVQVLADGNLYYGFTLDDCDVKCNLTLLRQETSAKELALTENLDTALLLSQDLLNQHLFNENGYVPTIVTTIFLKDTIFVDEDAMGEHSNVVTKVVGVAFPNFDETYLNGKLTLLYNLDSDRGLNYTTCSVYQKFHKEPTIINGFWNKEIDSELKNNFETCVFWKLKYFALIKNSMNITSTLELFLQSNDNIFIILNKTDYLTQRFYEFFEPIDVFYLAQILQRVSYSNETILDITLDIISNIMDMDSTMLKVSQTSFKATDIILEAFNKIVERHTESTEIYKKNAVLIVALLKNIKKYEVLLANCSENCVIALLYNMDADFESTSYQSLDAQLVINPKLIANLNSVNNATYIPRMVLTFFYNNSPFVDKNGVQSATQIFGIRFPEYDSNLSHEIKLKIQPPADSSSDDFNCVKWIYGGENSTNEEGYWSYESKPRVPNSLSCNFYQQGYFSLTEDDGVVPDVTPMLEDTSNSNTAFISKLHKLQDISYYYSKFVAYDVYLFSSILSQCNELADGGLDMVSIVIDNVLRTSENVLVESRINYNALRIILNEINRIAGLAQSGQNFELHELFGVAVCQLKSNSANGVILTKSSIKCSQVDDVSFNYAQNVISTLIVSKEVVSQAMAADENAKIIVSAFFSNAFFNVEGMDSSPLILGLSIPNVNETLEGDIVILFNNTLNDDNTNDCGYWQDMNNWKVSSGESNDMFKRCVYSEVTYYSLLEGHNINITKILEAILNADSTSLIKLQRTLNVISLYLNEFKAYHVHLISEIFSTVDEVNLASLKVTANITSSIMNLPREVLADSQDQYGATDYILYYIDRIAEKINDQEVQILTENFALIISNNIGTILIEKCNSQCNVILYPNNTGLVTNINNVIISNEDDPLIKDPSHIVVTVFYNNVLFNEGRKLTYENIGPIIGMVLPQDEGAFTEFFKFDYKTESKDIAVCAFWDYTVEDDGITKGNWKRDPIPPPSPIYSCEINHTAHFALLQAEKNVTGDLENVLNSNATAKEKLDKVVLIITELAGKLEAVDIYLISKILEIAMKQIDAIKMNLASDIISGLFNVTRHVLWESQTKYSATDKILHTIDEMTKMLTTTGLDPIVKENFTVVIYDLKDTDIRGVILEDCYKAHCSISPIEGAMNLTEIVNNEKLQTAIVLSEELRNQVRYSGTSCKLVVTIYFSDVLFNEQSEREEKVSMVSGVLLPGFNESFLGNLYVIFNSGVDSKHHYNSSCAFWNFQIDNGGGSVKGSWSSEEEPHLNNRFTVCEYEHVTHFALLLALDDSTFGPDNLYNILDIITAIESVLSVIGLLGILLTAALFERWRRNTGNQILVHFSVAISIKMVMLYVSAEIYVNGSFEIACSITGAILHYSILSEFCWMLIIAILQFKRFVEVLGGPPKFVLLKACICGWLFPLLPVLLILLIDKDNYNQGQVGLCYPSGLGLYLGIWLPLIIIVSINFVIFIFIIYNVFHKKTETRDQVNHEILFQWRLALLLFSMLGLTWLFGFLAQIPGAENIFAFLFSITATLQGFIMFLFFIVFNKSTRFLYSQSIKFWLYSRGYKQQ